jgi:23S rRNA (uracil1939-C5)-methyltransferase
VSAYSSSPSDDDRSPKRRLRAQRDYKVRFNKLTDDGFGAGNGPCGYEIRALGGIPGEQARVRLEHVSPHHPLAWGRILKITEKSPHRVSAPCARALRCGGCPWMQLAYDAQVAEKRARLQRLLAELRDRLSNASHPTIGPAVTATPVTVEPSPQTLHYRNRGKYILARKGDGVVVGAYRPRTHRVISTLGCPVVEPAVDITAKVLAGLLGRSALPIYNERTQSGVLRYAGARANLDGEVLATLVVTERGDGKEIEALARALQSEWTGVVGITLHVNKSKGNVLFAGPSHTLWGRSTLTDRFGTTRVQLKGQSFLQINRGQATGLYAHVTKLAGKRFTAGGANPAGACGRSPIIWDLFCGTGAIALALGRCGASVLGIEKDENSVALARAEATRAAIDDRCTFVAADAHTCLAHNQTPQNSPRPDVVVVNPPRAGCRSELLVDLAGAGVDRIVYISCNPTTLLRDLTLLGKRGYTLSHLRGFDMMPHTPHLETVAALDRGTDLPPAFNLADTADPTCETSV